MSNIINIIGLNTVNFIKGRKGEFRAISKARGGYLTISDFRNFENENFSENPSRVLNYYKKGALQSVEFKPEGSDYWITVFARVGKKIKVVDVDILKNLKVGTVNSLWFNTELYNSYQYKAVNAKSWESMAFVENKVEEELAI